MINNPQKSEYIKDISNRDYHAMGDYVSSSQLKLAIDGPYLFQRSLTEKKEEREWKIDQAMDWGTVVHTLILEPEKVESEIRLIDREKFNLRKKEDREALAKLKEESDSLGMTLVTVDAFKKAKDVIERGLKESSLFKAFWEEEKIAEMSGFATCPSTGVNIRWRPDAKLVNKSEIWDVKTTRHINIKEFKKDATFRLHYDLSAGHYLYGDKLVTGEECDWYFLCVENTGMERIAVYKASPAYLNEADRKFKIALSNAKKALEANAEKRIIPYQEKVEEI